MTRKRIDSEKPASNDGSEMMRAIAAASLDALITIDDHSTIVEFSPAAEKLFGFARAEVLGRSVAEIVIPPRMRQAHEDGMAKYQRTGVGPVINTRVEVPAQRRNGQEFTAELTVVPLKLQGDQLFTAFVRDISEQKKQAELLQRARDEAENASRAKSRFLAAMGHELRTPLNTVLGAIELIQDGELEERESQLAKMARGAGQTLLELIDQILDFTHMQKGEIALATTAVDLRKLLQDLASGYQSITADRNLDFQLELDQELPPRVKADARRLSQVLNGLLGNAIKFTDAGEVNLTCRVLSRQADAVDIHFSVRDTGCGVDPEIKDKLFDEFTLADDSDTTPYSGTGLGLALAQRLVTAMGGQIEAHSTPGQGSRFEFQLTLPLAAVDDDEPPKDSDEQHEILLVEDGVTNQMVARAMLERAGYAVDLAVNGAEAVAAIERKQYRAVLMDLRMPVMDGVEATRQIRAARHLRARVPIIALTANVTPADRERCRHAGMNDFIAKPIDREHLLERLRVWCRPPLPE